VLAKRLVSTLLIAMLGYGVARLFGFHDLQDSQPYLLIATVLLAVGLFGSTHEISILDISGNVKLVLTVVTLGVVVKAALVAGVLYAIFRDPAFIVLGVAVAQIDPLSVAVMRQRSRMSGRAKAILSAWSAFDDPVTAILAVYLSTVALGLGPSTSNGDHLMGGYSNVGVNVLLNALLVAGVYVAWRLLRTLGDRDRMGMGSQSWPVWLRVLAVGALLAAGAIAVDGFLMLGVALAGLFFRPGIGQVLRGVTPVAFTVAVLMLGMVLAGGVNLLPGVLLGVSAFAAQAIVGLLIHTRSLLRGDRLRLALGQQNGITAIILALLLETLFPGTIAIVGPAILVINVLHLGSNAIVDRVEDRRVATVAASTGSSDLVMSSGIPLMGMDSLLGSTPAQAGEGTATAA